MSARSIGAKPGSRLNSIWRGMKARCYNPRRPSFSSYGGRGITVCSEWQTFVGFLDWALLNGYADGLEIDRIDADGPYCPANCRWVSPRVNRQRRELDRGGAYIKTLGGLLTRDAVEAAHATGAIYKLRDGKGLDLWVSKLGRKSWRYRFRIEGREKTLTIGRYPAVSLWEARELLLIARAQVARGLDPAALKQLARARRQASTGIDLP